MFREKEAVKEAYILLLFREKEAVREAYNLFNEYADRIIGPENNQENDNLTQSNNKLHCNDGLLV